MKSKTDKSIVVLNHRVPRLHDILLALIAQDVQLSKKIIQDQTLELEHIKMVLKASTSFIQLIPEVLIRQINSFLSAEDWKSLYHVNKEWREAVTTSVNLYLNKSSDLMNLQQIKSVDIDIMELFLLSLLHCKYIFPFSFLNSARIKANNII